MRYLDFGRAENTTARNALPGAEGITATDHILQISPQLLQYHSTTLTCIEFYGATLLSNIEAAVINCVNMKELTFTYVMIDEYQPTWLRGEPEILLVAPKLQVLELNNARRLSQDENILLDFLLHSVSTPSLRSITIGRMTYGYSVRHMQNEVVQKYGYHPPSSTMAKFLIKCSATLRSLSIRRHQFLFVSSEDVNSDLLRGLSKLRIHKIRFQCDAIGIHHLIRSLTRLEKLDCYSHHEATQLKAKDFPALQTALVECIQRNCRTLRNFRGIGIISFPPESPPGEGQISQCVKFDLAALKDCTKLTNFALDRQENYARDESSAHHLEFTAANFHVLPESLAEVELWLGYIDSEDLCRLTFRIRDLTNLQFLQVTTAVRFTVTSLCFKNIVTIENSCLQAYFYNGFLADDFYPQKILQDVRSEGLSRQWEVKIAEHGCEFISKDVRNLW